MLYIFEYQVAKYYILMMKSVKVITHITQLELRLFVLREYLFFASLCIVKSCDLLGLVVDLI